MKKNFKNLLIILCFLLSEIIFRLVIENCDNCRLPLYIMFTSLLSLVIIYTLFFTGQKNSQYLLIRLILNVKGEAGSWYGIFSVIFVILNMNWLSNQIYDFWGLDISKPDYSNNLTLNILRSFYYLCFMFIPFLFPLFSSTEDLPQPKLLICGLSTPVNRINGKNDSDIITELRKSYTLPNDRTEKVQFDLKYPIKWGKWDVIRKSLVAHSSIKKVLLVISPEINEFNKIIDRCKGTANEDLFNDFNLENLFQRFFNERKIKICYTSPVDVNNFDNIKCTIQATLQSKEYNKLKDSEIVFNLTGSTAVVSSAMVLFAMKGNRKAEYVTQNTSELVSIDVDVLSVQDLWDEILLKIEEKKLS